MALTIVSLVIFGVMVSGYIALGLYFLASFCVGGALTLHGFMKLFNNSAPGDKAITPLIDGRSEDNVVSEKYDEAA
jgi:hypothetical protein